MNRSNDEGPRTPDRVRDAHAVPEGIVRVRNEAHDFLGTGVVIAPGIVVSCAHVCAGYGRVRVESARGAQVDADLLFPPNTRESLPHRLATHAGDDLAVLQLAGALPEASLRLVEGVTARLLEGTAGELELAGYRGPRGSSGAAHGLKLRGAPFLAADRTVRSAQIDGGVPPGLSGSPLLVRRESEWLMVGLFFLGGEGAGQSTFYGSDLVIALLRRLGIDPRVRAAEEHLSRSSVRPSGAALDDTVDAETEPHEPASRGRDTGFGPGTLIAGKYRVEQTLGGGGMGVVVAAHHVGLDERVALKLLHEHLALGANDVARFRREARTVAQLQSEHVVRIRDVDTTERGIPYIVMEYLEGCDLSERLRKGPIPVEEVVDYALQTCAALEEAHSRGIVHRDLKPANLFLSRNARGKTCLKVLDFGIAKALGGATALRLTDTHHLVGSPLYMAPEQMRSSSAASHQSDIWSLGVVLFELLTGNVPFPAESLAELCLKVTRDRVPALRGLRQDVPAALQEIVEKCLQKEPSQRYPHVGALVEALSRVASNEHARASRRPRRMVIALLLGFSLLVAATTVYLFRHDDASPVEQQTPPEPPRSPTNARTGAVEAAPPLPTEIVPDAAAATHAAEPVLEAGADAAVRNDAKSQTRSNASDSSEAARASRRAPERRRPARPASRPPALEPHAPALPQDAFPAGRD